jgi:hypothetical protein
MEESVSLQSLDPGTTVMVPIDGFSKMGVKRVVRQVNHGVPPDACDTDWVWWVCFEDGNWCLAENIQGVLIPVKQPKPAPTPGVWYSFTPDCGVELPDSQSQVIMAKSDGVSVSYGQAKYMPLGGYFMVPGVPKKS